MNDTRPTVRRLRAENERQRATLAKVAAIVADPDAALVVDQIRGCAGADPERKAMSEELDAGQPWSHEVPAYCGVTREQYPDPRPCPAPDPVDGLPEPGKGLCHLGHPYNCRRYLTDQGIDWRAKP